MAKQTKYVYFFGNKKAISLTFFKKITIIENYSSLL